MKRQYKVTITYLFSCLFLEKTANVYPQEFFSMLRLGLDRLTPRWKWKFLHSFRQISRISLRFCEGQRCIAAAYIFSWQLLIFVSSSNINQKLQHNRRAAKVGTISFGLKYQTWKTNWIWQIHSENEHTCIKIWILRAIHRNFVPAPFTVSIVQRVLHPYLSTKF